MQNLLKEERQQLILETIRQNGKVTVAELSQQFGISEVTIRRDLSDLATSGELVRSHRGALAATPAPPEPPVVQRMLQEQAVKKQIGKAAATLVTDGDSIFIGSGSTTAFLVRYLAHCNNLTVVTNSVGIAHEFAIHESSATVVLTGGMMRKDELSLLGHIAELSLREMRVDKMFMGVQALSIESGWTTDHLPEVTTTRRVIDMCDHLITLADHTKLGRVAAAFIAPAKRIEVLVTDPQADPTFLENLKRQGSQVMIAPITASR